jgi:hypothetical protein
MTLLIQFQMINSYNKIINTIFRGLISIHEPRLGKNQLPPKPQRKELMIVNNDKANNINIKLKIKYFIKLFLYEQALTK